MLRLQKRWQSLKRTLRSLRLFVTQLQVKGALLKLGSYSSLESCLGVAKDASLGFDTAVFWTDLSAASELDLSDYKDNELKLRPMSNGAFSLARLA